MRPAIEGGSRFAIVLNGSPLFTGVAGSGESEIRRYVLENDLVEAIIQLPTDMFYNTGITTYIWILSNKKSKERKGKVQLIDASNFWQRLRKNLGKKGKELLPEHIEKITKIYGMFNDAKECGKPVSKIFQNEYFKYQSIIIERPLLDPEGNLVLRKSGKRKGQKQPDLKLRDTEIVPFPEEIDKFFQREVIPHLPDAWIDHEKNKIGYEINFNRYFYVFKSPRPLEEINTELNQLTGKIIELIKNLSD